MTWRVGEFHPHPRPAGSLDFPFWTMKPPSCVRGTTGTSSDALGPAALRERHRNSSQEIISSATSSDARPSGEATSSKATSSEATSSKATTSEATSKHQADWEVDKTKMLWGTAANWHMELGPPTILGKRKMPEQPWQDYG